MSYRIVYAKAAVKFLRKQPKEQQIRIVRAVHALPTHGDTKPLSGSPGKFRLRVGDYRILYTIDQEALVIQVIKVGNRGDVYKAGL